MAGGRGAVVCVLLVSGCAGRGEVARREVTPASVAPEEAPVPEPARYGMCGTYMAARGGPAAFERGELLFKQAAADYEASRVEAAARGYLAAAAEFHAAQAEDPSHATARANMRIAFADAALAWLAVDRVEEARGALAQAQAGDGPLRADWQRAIDELPRPPRCGHTLEEAKVGPAAAEPASTVVEPEPEPAAAAEEPVAACGKIERGSPQPRHGFIGQTVAELADSGGHVLCGRDPVWQLRFGTLCGDMASFHKVVTVEVKAGKVRRVWQREQYNAGFCGE